MMRIISTAVVTLCFFLMSCETSDDDLTRYIDSVKARPTTPVEPLPEFKPLLQFSYPEQDNRRSPFKPIRVANDQFAPNTKRPKQPLEAFPLDALKFVGILKQGAVVWGLILQPDGVVTRVRAGDYMGKNYGQVTLVTDREIKLEESISSNGHWEKRKINFELYQPEKGHHK